MEGVLSEFYEDKMPVIKVCTVQHLMGLFHLPIKLTVDVRGESSGISRKVIVIHVLQINGALQTKQNAQYVHQTLCLFQVHQIVTVLAASIRTKL